jgi:hypothetical protein
MRTAVAGLVGVAAVASLVALAAAAPPEDVAAYCRATYPQLQLQLRCLNVEHAAASRVAQAAVAVNREAVNRCLTASPSWSAAESCLAQAARGGLLPTPVASLPPAAERSGSPLEQAANPPAVPSAMPPALPSAMPPALPGAIPPVLPGVIPPADAVASDPSPSAGALAPSLPDPSVALAPLPAAPAAALAEPERPPRPISEADAERHLRSVLERAGTPRARCTKKQYGPGWASICE